MKPPRVSIGTLMAVVVIVALDFGIGREVVRGTEFHGPLFDLTLFALMPMANVLAVGLVVLLTLRHRPAPGYWSAVGFELGGMLAWLGLLAASLWATRWVHELPDELAPGFVRQEWLFLAFAIAFFFLPQLALALLGLALGRWYGSRRSSRVSPTMVEP